MLCGWFRSLAREFHKFAGVTDKAGPPETSCRDSVIQLPTTALGNCPGALDREIRQLVREMHTVAPRRQALPAMARADLNPSGGGVLNAGITSRVQGFSHQPVRGAFGPDHNLAQKCSPDCRPGQLQFGCLVLDFEYRRFALGALRRENQFRVALSLANVGTFGNLKPRERLY
jgi:hypothetical protein